MRPDTPEERHALDSPPLHSLVLDFGVGFIAKRIHVARRGGLLVLGALHPSWLRVCRSRELVHAVDAHFDRYNAGVGRQSGRESGQEMPVLEPVGEKFSRVALSGTRGSEPRESVITGRWIRRSVDSAVDSGHRWTYKVDG